MAGPPDEQLALSKPVGTHVGERKKTSVIHEAIAGTYAFFTSSRFSGPEVLNPRIFRSEAKTDSEL